MPETTEPLTEAQVDEIESRLNSIDRQPLTVAAGIFLDRAVPALIRDWRAMKASVQHHYDLWLALKQRHAHKFADESGAWADTCQQCGVTTSDDHDGYDCIAWLQRQNAVLREQLAQAQRTITALQKQLRHEIRS